MMSDVKRHGDHRIQILIRGDEWETGRFDRYDIVVKGTGGKWPDTDRVRRDRNEWVTIYRAISSNAGIQ